MIENYNISEEPKSSESGKFLEFEESKNQFEQLTWRTSKTTQKMTIHISWVHYHLYENVVSGNILIGIIYISGSKYLRQFQKQQSKILITIYPSSWDMELWHLKLSAAFKLCPMSQGELYSFMCKLNSRSDAYCGKLQEEEHDFLQELYGSMKEKLTMLGYWNQPKNSKVTTFGDIN